MCQRPDGHFLNLGETCGVQEPICPAGTEYCGNSNQCCNPGNYCSRYGCTPEGAVDCGNSYCNPGQQCSRSGGCQPEGSVDCGPYYCQPGQRCGRSHRACLADDDTDCGGHHCGSGQQCARGGRCIPTGAVDCGPGKGYCDQGKKCGRTRNVCLDKDAVDCGSYSCNAGSKCGSGNKCLAAGEVDCGSGKSCSSGQKCSRGGGCIDKTAIDCGRGLSCTAGNKCIPGGGCAPADAVICKGNSRYCPKGTQCVGSNECLTTKEIADRAAEVKRKQEEERRAAAAKKQQEADDAKRRAQEAAAQRVAEAQARRQGIQAMSAPRGMQAAAAWNLSRIRKAIPTPLPVLTPGSPAIGPVISRPAPPTAVFPPSDSPSKAQNIPENLKTPPLKWAGKLFYRAPGGDAVCSAQFIAPGVILTAAHCVRDHITGQYYSNFAFALQYHHGAYSRRYGWKCIATPDEWVDRSEKRYQRDYAMLLAEDTSPTGHFGWRPDGSATNESIVKIGYPQDIDSGQIMRVATGPVVLHEGVIELRHGDVNNKQGSSGGAWIAKYQTASDPESNLAISVTSFGVETQPGVAYGPYFDDKFKRMLEYVSNGCQ